MKKGVPFTAGGPTDVAMRAISEGAAKHLGQPIIIDNKAGGSGTVGPATMAAVHPVNRRTSS